MIRSFVARFLLTGVFLSLAFGQKPLFVIESRSASRTLAFS
jgi:hypothetical protein